MNNLLNATQRFLKRNSSTILTVIGAGGVVATAVLAAKATPKAMRLLEEAQEEKGEDLTVLEKVRTAGPAYIPSVLVGASTIACIFGANVLNQRHQASIMSAYAFLDNSYKEYKKKVIEEFGEGADEKVRNELMEDKYEELGIPFEGEDDGKELFFDYNSMQYFRSTMVDVLQAENRFNKMYARHGYAALNEFYDALGIPRVEHGYDFGWSMEASGTMYGYDWVDFEHEKITLDCGLECWIITMNEGPVYGYLGF